MFALVAAGCGGGGGGDENTLVFGTASDPTGLDAALISDGESIRVLYQMTEGLTRAQAGHVGGDSVARDGLDDERRRLAWTFNLREDVTFHDGEPFNAEAVCFNFERWFNFPQSLQGEGTTYYWQFGFGGGFKNPAEGNPGPDESLYKSCEAVDENTVDAEPDQALGDGPLDVDSARAFTSSAPRHSRSSRQTPARRTPTVSSSPAGPTPPSTRPAPGRTSSSPGPWESSSSSPGTTTTGVSRR